MLPFLYDNSLPLRTGDIIVVKDVAKVLDEGRIEAEVVRGEEVYPIVLTMDSLTAEEKRIIKAGCLINANRADA